MKKKKGIIFVISSPSGAGKTSIANAILQQTENLEMSISVTTRKARPTEIDGVDYFFVNEKIFHKMINNSELLEHAKVFDNLYGTPKEKVLNRLEEGVDVLFDIDWQGARMLREKCSKIVTIYILPPSLEELSKRLRKRAEDSEETIEQRLAMAESEMVHWPEYDYVVVNENLENSIQEVQAIITSERLKSKYFQPKFCAQDAL